MSAAQYPDDDFPWTMYFNGHPMPRWANCWHLIPILGRAEDLMREWSCTADFKRLWSLSRRIDHCGAAESEDPEIFRVCCTTLIYLMLRDEQAILDEMTRDGASRASASVEIFTGVRDGLFAMNHRCREDGFAFWGSGYEADREFLCEYIRRYRLPQGHPDWVEPPHMGKFRRENLWQVDSMRRDIVALLGTRPLPKEVRRLIHELPKES
jgi:hypothetical protein